MPVQYILKLWFQGQYRPVHGYTTSHSYEGSCVYDFHKVIKVAESYI